MDKHVIYMSIENFPSRAELYDLIKEYNKREKQKISFSDINKDNCIELACENMVY
jgi:hypothetical protein